MIYILENPYEISLAFISHCAVFGKFYMFNLLHHMYLAALLNAAGPAFSPGHSCCPVERWHAL